MKLTTDGHGFLNAKTQRRKDAEKFLAMEFLLIPFRHELLDGLVHGNDLGGVPEGWLFRFWI
jgi:hypothetical protein